MIRKAKTPCAGDKGPCDRKDFCTFIVDKVFHSDGAMAFVEFPKKNKDGCNDFAGASAMNCDPKQVCP